MKEIFFDKLIETLFNPHINDLEAKIKTLFSLDLEQEQLKKSIIFLNCRKDREYILPIVEENLLKIEPSPNGKSDLISTYINLINFLQINDLRTLLENHLVYEKFNQALNWDNVFNTLINGADLNKYKLIIKNSHENKTLYFNQFKQNKYSNDNLLIRAIDDGYSFTQKDWDEQFLVCDYQEIYINNANSAYETKMVKMPFNLDLELYYDIDLFFKIFKTNPNIVLPNDFAAYFITITSNTLKNEDSYRKTNDYHNNVVFFMEKVSENNQIKLPKYVINKTLKNIIKNNKINSEEKAHISYLFYQLSENKEIFEECLNKNFNQNLKPFFEHKTLTMNTHNYIEPTIKKKSLKI